MNLFTHASFVAASVFSKLHTYRIDQAIKVQRCCLLSCSEGEPGDLGVGPRRHDQERSYRKGLPWVRRCRESAEALGRHAVQPSAAGRSVAQPAVGRAGQLHAGPEEEDAHPQQAEGKHSAV